MRPLISRFLMVFLAVCAAGVVRAQREKLPPEDLAIVESSWPAAKKTNTGIRYIIEREGHGAPPVPGDLVSVTYTGRLLDGVTFDESLDPKHPLVFRVARETVIQGWDFVIQQMKLGERRLVIIPPELAYGTRGQPPRIPRNATLVFVMELVDIKRE
ncbi:MAG: peptidylprolyl isomerase [Verrucomicrobia bacterium]|nr:peptidylprolyl isomerase [Verrucomicrobiota bacterium]